MVVVYILLFIVFLSILIMVHELGHLATAKLFKVYCFEYSIGFGPKLFSFKRKNGETAVSLRAIPFGGFVSMYGEGVEVPEGIEIAPERSLNNISAWKRSIILVAGVTMNAILAIIGFVICNACFPTPHYYISPITITETCPFADQIGEGDYISFLQDEKEKVEKPGQSGSETYDELYVVDRAGTVSFNDTSIPDRNLIILFSTAIKSDKALDYINFLSYRFYEDEKVGNELSIDASVKSISFKFRLSKPEDVDENGKRLYNHSLNINLSLVKEGETYKMPDLGVRIGRDTEYTKGKIFQYSMKDFGESSSLIVRALGQLFVSQKARESTGGIIAVGVVSSNYLKNFGFGTFLKFWSMISVNLAIVNLLPFPGLDGWQLLVTIVEGVSRKKIPEKAKNIVSFVGIALLFGLMILLVFKDLFTFVF